jgi:integrase
MPTIRKRGDYQYQAIIRRRGFPPLTKTFISKRDAESWATRIESEMLRGTFVDRTEAERTTLGELIDRYLKEVTPTKRGAATSSEDSRANVIKRDSLASYNVAALSGKILAEYRDRRLQKVSGSTVNRELNMISHVLNTARKEWGIECSNPVAYIRRPRENKARERRLQPGEKDLLLSTLEVCGRNPDGTFTEGMHNPWIKPLVEMAIETAMRRGELLSLRWIDIDLQKRTARLHATKNGESRTVPLSSRAKTILEALPRSIDGRVFPTTPDAIKKAFTRACERAGIDGLRFHDLRHEATSLLFERGVFDMMEVATITGHKTLSMLRRYTHLRAEDLAKKLG